MLFLSNVSVLVLCASTDDLLFTSQAAPTSKEIVVWPTWYLSNNKQNGIFSDAITNDCTEPTSVLNC
jgi:TolB-like protein